MDLVSALAPPRLCRLAGEDVWVRPASLDDLAVVMAWLDDVLPDKAARSVPPSMGDEASIAALESRNGRAVVAYAALRHRGATMADATRAVDNSDAVEWATFLAAFFARRRTEKGDGPGDGRGLSEVWFGPDFATICERYPGHTLESIGRLTLDQYALLMGQGLPEEDPRHLTWEQVEAMRLEGLRLRAEREAALNVNGEGAAE